MVKFFKIILNKGIQAPKLTWKTSWVGAKINTLIQDMKNIIKPNKLGKDFKNAMWSDSQPEIDKVLNQFKQETGINMHLVDKTQAYCFEDFANVLLRDINNGNFPKDIKHIVFGHGMGTSVLKDGKDSWRSAFNPKIKIFDFIEQNIPEGEKVLVNCCETTPKQYKHLLPKDKPAIGYPTYTDASSSYYHPLKIVESGKSQIIGAYANGIMTLYR